MFFRIILILALIGSAPCLMSGQSLDWVFLDPDDGCGTVVTDCSTGQQCYGLQYTPALTGTVTSYTLGFLANCVNGGTASLRGSSCTMTDNTDILSACAQANLIQILPSGNSGSLAVTNNSPVILHEVCVTLPMGTSMTFNEDESLALTVSVDLAGGGAATDVLNYSSFTASSADCGSALPVTWESFTARQAGKSAILDWSTSSEVDHDYFTVEWGTDGRTFTPIFRVQDPAQQQGGATTYYFEHQNPTAGINYYRIRQVDFSGAHSFSTIESLRFFPTEASAFTLYPNPAQHQVQLRLSEAAVARQALVYTLTGELMTTSSINPQGGVARLSLNELPPGIYIVRVGTQSQKLIRQ